MTWTQWTYVFMCQFHNRTSQHKTNEIMKTVCYNDVEILLKLQFFILNIYASIMYVENIFKIVQLNNLLYLHNVVHIDYRLINLFP